MRKGKETLLPISERPVPQGPTWSDEEAFLREAGAQSIKTETTYRSGLRLFADWLQHYRRAGYAKTDAWPLKPDGLTTDVILDYRNWLLANRSRATVTISSSAPFCPMPSVLPSSLAQRPRGRWIVSTTPVCSR